MNETATQIKHSTLHFSLFSALGCGLISLSSFLEIPFYPVPFTMETVAVLFLALTQPPKQALSSSACYLLLGSLGLPVFGGHIDPLWITTPSAGYLIAFPLAAYVAAILARKGSTIRALMTGKILIFTLGFLWLIPSFGIYTSFEKGVLLFLGPAIGKSFITAYLARIWKRWRQS